jgi:hypothetical protein
MDINILVRPVYERQRAQSTDVSNPDVNHALCVPMGTHIGRVSLYAGMPNLDTPTDRSLCHTFVEPMDANDHSQLTSLSPDVEPCDNHAQCRAHTIHSFAIGLRLSYDL